LRKARKRITTRVNSLGRWENETFFSWESGRKKTRRKRGEKVLVFLRAQEKELISICLWRPETLDVMRSLHKKKKKHREPEEERENIKGRGRRSCGENSKLGETMTDSHRSRSSSLDQAESHSLCSCELLTITAGQVEKKQKCRRGD